MGAQVICIRLLVIPRCTSRCQSLKETMQSTACAVAFLVLTPALGLKLETSMSSSLTFDSEAAKNRPVTKVITLLKDMSKQLEKEGDEDQDIYDKMACWCLTNEKEKKKSIEDAES